MRLPKLVTSLTSYIVIGKKQLYLVNPNIDKRELTRIKRRFDLKNPKYSEKVIFTNSFDLRLKKNLDTGELNAYISNNKELPTDEEYQVLNFDPSTTADILLLTKNVSGLLENKVEVCFSSKDEDLITFVSEEMPYYQEVSVEMIRSFFVTSGKRTKKWKPGNRYDNSTTTFYYLGSYLCRKNNDISSNFYNTKDHLTPVGLYVNSLKGEKTIKEVLMTRRFSESDTDDGIKMIWGDLPYAHDSGNYLESEIPTAISSIYLDNIKNIPESERSTHITSIFNLLSCVSSDDCLEYSSEVKDIVRESVKGGVYNTLFNNWNIFSSDNDDDNIGSSLSISENTIGLAKLFINEIKDSNICKYKYYTDLFNALDINVELIARNALDNWNEDNLVSTFEDYLQNIGYFERRNPAMSNTVVQLDAGDRVTIKSLFGDTELTKVLLDIISYSRKNLGAGVSLFEVSYSWGNSSGSNITIKITLEDIIVFLCGEENMSDTLKKNIVDNRFTKLLIYFNSDLVLE